MCDMLCAPLYCVKFMKKRLNIIAFGPCVTILIQITPNLTITMTLKRDTHSAVVVTKLWYDVLCQHHQQLPLLEFAIFR